MLRKIERFTDRAAIYGGAGALGAFSVGLSLELSSAFNSVQTAQVLQHFFEPRLLSLDQSLPFGEAMYTDIVRAAGAYLLLSVLYGVVKGTVSSIAYNRRKPR